MGWSIVLERVVLTGGMESLRGIDFLPMRQKSSPTESSVNDEITCTLRWSRHQHQDKELGHFYGLILNTTPSLFAPPACVAPYRFPAESRANDPTAGRAPAVPPKLLMNFQGSSVPGMTVVLNNWPTPKFDAIP